MKSTVFFVPQTLQMDQSSMFHCEVHKEKIDRSFSLALQQILINTMLQFNNPKHNIKKLLLQIMHQYLLSPSN